jgi:hypothetical protein
LLLLAVTILLARNRVNATLASYFHSLKNLEKEKKELPLTIPPDVVKDIMKDLFIGDGSQGPYDHLIQAGNKMFPI